MYLDDLCQAIDVEMRGHKMGASFSAGKLRDVVAKLRAAGMKLLDIVDKFKTIVTLILSGQTVDQIVDILDPPAPVPAP